MEKRSFPDLHSTPVTGVQVQVQKSSAWTPVIITELVRISLEAQNKPQQLYKTDREECFSLDSFYLTCSWVKSQLEISLPLIGSPAAVCHHGLPDEHHVKVLGQQLVSQGPCFNVALSKSACKKIIFHVPLAFSWWLAFFAELCHNKVFNFKPKFVAIPARLLTIILVMNNG